VPDISDSGIILSRGNNQYGYRVGREAVVELRTESLGLVVTGTILVGSVMEFVSSRLAELKVIAVPPGAMCFAPPISTFTACAVPSVFTTFR